MKRTSACLRPSSVRPGRISNLDATLPGAGSAGLLSSAPTGLVKHPRLRPTACAVGCILSPLRGFRSGLRRITGSALVPIFCGQSAVEMRSHTRLPAAEFTLLSRSGPAGRTSDGEYLFGAEFSSHQTPSTATRAISSTSVGMPGSSCDLGVRLLFRDNRHGPALQKGRDQFAIYLQAAVVLDEAFLLERIHEFTYPCAGSTNHLR